MNKHLFGLFVVVFLTPALCFSQENNFWKKSTEKTNVREAFSEGKAPTDYQLFSLDVESFKTTLQNTPERGRATEEEAILISFPNSNGGFDNYKVYEANVLHPDLLAKYPGIKSYAGQGVDDPTATIRFSVSDQKGFHGMVLSGLGSTEYIDPYTEDKAEYVVYSRKSLPIDDKGITCLTEAVVSDNNGEDGGTRLRTDDKKLRKYRLALSCNAEYGNIFAGSSGTDAQKKANILAQMNTTITRVNGVYEKDLAITLEIIPNNDKIIYYGSTSSDPWSGEFNSKTQQVIDNAIGSSNYDIGHNFNTSGGGNAGCIGCVCRSSNKGSGYTGRSNPTGDAFDIDYVAHEMGHQFGGYHTMNTCSRSGSGSTEVEPTSGSSIMGYAGICDYNIQAHSDDYFNYVNIRDISANVQSGTSSSCAQVVSLSNQPPTAYAGPDYTIPKSTPFILHGEGSDPDGDALTFTWEQNDPEEAPGKGKPQSTWTKGPLFRSKKGTTSPDRYMPAIESVVAGNLAPDYEVVPSVARTLKFALTVRDNKAGGGQTSDDLATITVSNSGPFVVTAPNTNETWNAGQSKTVTWDVAGTNASPVNCSNVMIMLSTDGGLTYPHTLLASTANDGSADVTVPSVQSNKCRVMVKAVDNIFYDISNSNFTIGGSVTCTPSVPSGLKTVTIKATSATLQWNAVAGASYEVRYKVDTDTDWKTVTATSSSVEVTGLTPETKYQAQVKSICPNGGGSDFSASITFTTGKQGGDNLLYCASKSNSTKDEYIGKVELGAISNTSGGSTSGYEDFTSKSTILEQGKTYTATITAVWTGGKYNEGYAVWIDYNQDGDFSDSGEKLFEVGQRVNNPVSGTFVVPANAVEGKTRMRVSMKYNDVPEPCETFKWGEVEDYTVDILPKSATTCSEVKVTIVLDSYAEETSWKLFDEVGKVIGSGGNYRQNVDDHKTIEETFCVETNCARFEIYDAYSDGICCKYGNGSYKLTDKDGTVIKEGGSFAKSEITKFCFNNGRATKGDEVLSVGERKEFKESIVYPNPTRGLLNVQANDVKHIKVFNIRGEEMRSIGINNGVVDVSILDTGVYLITITTGKEVINKTFIKK